MHKVAKTLTAWILVSLCLLINHAQGTPIQYQQIKRFSADDGLPSTTIYSIVKQSTGHLLLGTNKGIVRYDGYGFEIFSKNNNNLVINNASNLFIDKHHNIWIGSWGEGLAIYDQHFNLLQHHSTENGFPAKIQTFYQDQRGDIWVGSNNAGLLHFSNSIFEYQQHKHIEGVNNSLSHNRIWQISQSEPNYLWLATNHGLNRFHIATRQFEHFIPNLLTTQQTVDNTIRTMLISPNKDKILVGTNNHIAVFDIKKQTFMPHNIKDNRLKLGVNQFSYGANQELLIATIIGLYRTNAEQLFCCVGKNIKMQSVIDGTDIRNITKMDNNLIWVGTRHSGLIKLNLVDNPVRHISELITTQGHKQLLGHVYTFFKDHDQTIWIGTRDHLAYLREGQNIPQKIPLKHNFNRINSIARTPQGLLIVRDNIDTYVLNKDYNQISLFSYPKATTSLNNGNIEHFASLDNQLWIIDNHSKLHRIDNKTLASNDIAISNDIKAIDAAFFDSTKRLWLSLNDRSIWYQHTPNSLKLERLKLANRSFSNINQISEDKFGNILFASKEGIYGYRPKSQQLNDISKDYQIHQEVLSVVADNDNNLWATHDDHIVKLSNQSKNAAIFGHLDGLNVALFQRGAAIKDTSGRLLFGGADGIDIIEPQNMKANNNPPKMYIGKLNVNNQPIAETELRNEQTLVLKSDENDINFEFIALELKQPRLNQYKFKLQGFDQQWSPISNNRFANYANLPAGDYTMLYTGSNNAGVWSTQTKQFSFTIEQAFHQTIYFYLVIFTGLVAAFYLSSYYTARFHRKRRKQLQIEVNAKTQDLKLLSNIGQKLSACLDNQSIFELLYQHLSERFDSHYFAIALCDRKNQTVNYQHVIEAGQLQSSFEINLNDNSHLSSWCINNEQEIIIETSDDIQNYISNYEQTQIRGYYASMLYLPLFSTDNQVTGCLTIQSKYANAYTAEQIDVARTLAGYSAVALNNARAYSQLEEKNQAIIDAQKQLVQSEKMASLGGLTAGVAHEINNPTNFVYVSCQNMSVELKKFQDFINELIADDADPEILASFDERFAELFDQIDTIFDGSHRIKTIVHDLRAFSRLDVVERQPVSLAKCIDSTVHLIKTKFDQRIGFNIDINPDITIECNQSQFNQVLMNIIINGCDAILETKDKQGTIELKAQLMQQQVQITIADNGPGMDETIQQKVFEPFFTTKPVGKGTGLGLSISFGIISDHQGTIEVTSEVGKGTQFIITMPLQQKSTD